uniref:FAD-binding PCMH-type domain-containing protein n=1 Tax=Bionectria ochroleuca TaxID=29856 RepID=A0A8H7K335_BIOOC
MIQSPLYAVLLAAFVAQPALSRALSEIDDSASTLSTKGCSILADAGLGGLLLLPHDLAYTEREASYWAPNAALGPRCILQPRTTEDVSRAVKAVAASGAKFAIRSGGHSQWAGGSNVHNGVTIDLGRMTDITYNAQTTVASIQPGPRWGDIFAALKPYGVALTGGRDADVGIGGFLTGGGNAYLTARTGFGCDTVVNFEVVLANGTIVNANKTANADLWRALKGGWANFGVTTAAPEVWGSTQIHDGSVGDQAAAALVKFTNENEDNPEAAHLVLRTYNTVTPQGIGMITVMVDTKNVENAPVFNDIRAIPSTIATSQHTTLGQLAQNGIDPSDDHVHWFTLTFNNDIAILKKAMALHDSLAADLKTTLGPAAFSTQCVLQPIPSFFGTIGARKGGNMLGLDAVKTNSILWLGTVAYKDPDNDKVTYKKLEKSFRELEKFAKSRNGNVEWLYINYADKTQNPLKSYGKANLDFMKNVAGTYDPKGVFQEQMPGSFKLSKV